MSYKYFTDFVCYNVRQEYSLSSGLSSICCFAFRGFKAFLMLYASFCDLVKTVLVTYWSYAGWWWNNAYRYLFVWTDFLYNVCRRFPFSSFISITSRYGNWLFWFVSIINLIFGCFLLKWSKNFWSLSFSCVQIMKVSSTFLNQTLGLFSGVFIAFTSNCSLKRLAIRFSYQC